MTSSAYVMSAARLEASVDRLCGRDIDSPSMLRGLADRLRTAIPCDGFLLLRTDPTTVLPTDGVVDALPPALCRHFWDNELLETDYNKFVDLARRKINAATLSAATDGDLTRSRRYANLYRPLGLGDELRVSFTARDGSCWGIAQLARSDGDLFTDVERDLLLAASSTIAEGLRGTFVATSPARSGLVGPALILLDEDGDVRAITPAADHWMTELVRGSATGMRPVPEPIYLVAGRARAARAGVTSDPPRVRVRTTAGVWLHLHAACIDGTDALNGAVAVVITPARAPDLAPLIALAYRITAREQEVLQFIARGFTTAEMARELGISRHTVRDHVKALFTKVGVRSRTELVARVFADHYFEHLRMDTGMLADIDPSDALERASAVGAVAAEHHADVPDL
ncbi:MAG TPA: helix-turn-helix transcriptional regulator [Euzebyales bacterium]|nr:helix-turn-helix transcriptional regulator [Euzebyales bacterium]